jgi:uncharacterized protein with FMN-binding domain
MKKARKKMIGWIIVIIIVTALGIGGGIGWSKLSKEHQEAANLPLNRVNFTNLKDGTYHGAYEGGMYKWRVNECQVKVEAGKVTEIKPLSGVVDQGNGSTQKLYDRVIKEQTLQVDTISGATLTAKAYLQAVENALVQAERE